MLPSNTLSFLFLLLARSCLSPESFAHPSCSFSSRRNADQPFILSVVLVGPRGTADDDDEAHGTGEVKVRTRADPAWTLAQLQQNTLQHLARIPIAMPLGTETLALQSESGELMLCMDDNLVRDWFVSGDSFRIAQAPYMKEPFPLCAKKTREGLADKGGVRDGECRHHPQGSILNGASEPCKIRRCCRGGERAVRAVSHAVSSKHSYRRPAPGLHALLGKGA